MARVVSLDQHDTEDGYSFCNFTNLLKSFEYNGGSYFMCKYVDGKGQVRSYQDMMKEAGYTLNLKRG